MQQILFFVFSQLFKIFFLFIFFFSRYITNNKSQLRIMWNKDTSPNTKTVREGEEKDELFMLIKFLPNSFKDFILPAGFPGTNTFKQIYIFPRIDTLELKQTFLFVG